MPADAVPVFPFNRTRNPLPAPNRSQPRLGELRPSTSTPSILEPRADQPTDRPSSGRDLQADAERFLQANRPITRFDPRSPDWLSRAGLNVRKASDRQHIQAIALAYAASVQIAASPHRTTLMAELERASGRKRSRATTDLHLIVERFISYGGESASERLAARKLISRDVRAIQHLAAKTVLPSQVAELAASRGEGLHAWARQSATVKKARTGPEDQTKQDQHAKAEARERALVHEVRITTRRVDGRRVRRQRFTITGAAQSEMAGLLQRLKRLAKERHTSGSPQDV